MTNPSADPIGKVGIIAGGGDLPLRVAGACRASNRPYLVLGIEGWAGHEIVDYEHVWITLGGIGRTFQALKNAGCHSIVIAGYVKRPDFSKLKIDMTGTKLLPKILNAARKGDDAIISVLVAAFEKEGFKVRGAEEIFADLLAPQGQIGFHQCQDEHERDIEKARQVIHALGPLDVGQGAVVAGEHVLAIEAAEGTDEMLRRVAKLPEEVRGTAAAKKGVLVKIPKPGQERRVDLPTIGEKTVELADMAGLAGIAVAAKGALILDQERVVQKADQLGLFLYGLEESGHE